MALSSPTLPDTDSDAPNSRLPAWILLAKEGYIVHDDRGNATTAVAWMSSGQRIMVSFFAADPPRLSHFCVHCPGLTHELDFVGRPCILHTVDNLALIEVTFGCRFETRYFIYRAGRGRRPSLQYLRDIGSYLSEVPLVASIGILPCGDDGDDFVLAALSFGKLDGQYKLHVFLSEQGTWTSNVLVLGSRLVANIEKVISLGGGELGFVDLWKGILVCDVLRDNPTPRFIPLPKLLPSNQPDSPDEQLCPARSFRDVVVCTDGLIKCVEVEGCFRRIIHEAPQVSNKRIIHDEIPDDVSDRHVLYDSDLMPDRAQDTEEDDTEEDDIYEYLGWRVIAWSRTLSSTCWRKECLVHADDILVSNPVHTALLAELGGSNAPSLTLKDLFITVPSLSMDDRDSLYLISKVNRTGEEFCVAMVDMGKKTLKEISPILTGRPDGFRPTYIPCALSKYLNTDSDVTKIGG